GGRLPSSRDKPGSCDTSRRGAAAPWFLIADLNLARAKFAVAALRPVFDLPDIKVWVALPVAAIQSAFADSVFLCNNVVANRNVVAQVNPLRLCRPSRIDPYRFRVSC